MHSGTKVESDPIFANAASRAAIISAATATAMAPGSLPRIAMPLRMPIGQTMRASAEDGPW